ncbi:MAG: hypothetical protein ACRD22_08895 [Terriglobia bacterium]
MPRLIQNVRESETIRNWIAPSDAREEVDLIAGESLRKKGLIMVRVDPRIYDIHQGSYGGYRSIRGHGFTYQVTSVKAFYDTLQALLRAAQLGFPPEAGICERGHQKIWFAGRACPICTKG